MDELRVEQLRALADPLRLRIVELLRARGEVCVCRLFEALSTSQPNMSAHLRVLRQARLIRARKMGKWVFYALDADAATELLAWLGEVMTPVAAGPTADVACCGSEEAAA
jgi:ArsR family transcriptional regulator